MRIFRFTIPFAIGISLLASLALAQDLNFPDQTQRQGMSYEEYSALREKMRARLENMTPAERQELREKMQDIHRQDREEQRAYGQGYHARKRDMEQFAARPDKPDLPQRVERPDAPQRMERFQRH